MANTVLADCAMACLDERYALDRLLLDSFSKSDVECIADLIDNGIG